MRKKARGDQEGLLGSGPVGGVREKQLAWLSHQQCSPAMYALSSWSGSHSGGSTLQSALCTGDSISRFPVLQSAPPLGIFTLVQESITTSCSPRIIKDPWLFFKNNLSLKFLSPFPLPHLLHLSSCHFSFLALPKHPFLQKWSNPAPTENTNGTD